MDSFSFVKGSHSVKFGVDFTRTGDYLKSYAAGDQLGEYSYSYEQDFISDYEALKGNIAGGYCVTNNTVLGVTTTYNIPCYNDYFQTFGPLAFNVNTFEPSFFVQDDWHATSRLTVNMGLRWDHEAFPSPVLPNSAIPQTTVFPSDKIDFAPRIGFAWDLTGQGKTVLRGGYGMYYGRISNEQVYEEMTLTGSPNSQIAATIFPTQGNNNNTGLPTVGAPSYPNVLATYSPSVGKPNVAFFPSDFRLPGAEEFDAVFEHQVAANTSVSVSYIGSIGRFLPIGLDTNLPTPGTMSYTIASGPLAGGGNTVAFPFFSAPRPNSSYLKMVEFCTCVTSHYNAIVAQFNRKFTSGLQFNFSYTYSHSTDDGASSSPAITSNGPTNPYNLGLEVGTGYLDVPHRFIGTLEWEPRYFADSSNIVTRTALSGWTMSVNETAQTGLPFSASVSGNVPTGITQTQSSGGVTGGATSSRAIFLPKNAFTLPPTVNTDFLIARTFKLSEKVRFQLNAQVFNLFNHVDYTAETATAYTIGGTAQAPTLAYSSTFDTKANLTNANNGVFYTARQLQFGAKITF